MTWRDQLSVVTPPEPFVTPADIVGTHADDDAAVAAVIAAVTEEIDGPDGWLGRCLGEQTLDLLSPAFTCKLPCPPVLSVVSVKYLDSDGEEQTLASGAYRLAGQYLLSTDDWPTTTTAPDAVRIRYVAGYETVPERARQAVILATQHVMALQARDPFVLSEDVEGIGAKRYALNEAASKVVERACERLLSGLREY